MNDKLKERARKRYLARTSRPTKRKVRKGGRI